MPLIPGLVSISFRQLDPAEIVRLCVENAIVGIEWGGDVHVPVGDLKRARATREVTEQSGLRVSAYGSYFRAGQGTQFEPVIETAVALGAPTIRVWAGVKGSQEATVEEKERVIADLLKCVDLAKQEGVTVALEMHQGTLNDCRESSISLLEELPDIWTFWQPQHTVTFDENREVIRSLQGRISNAHVFNWEGADLRRRFLGEAADVWLSYFAELTGPQERFVSLEFMPQNDPQHLAQEAHTLRELILKSTI